MDMHVLATWLPLLKIEAESTQLRARVSVYVFGKRVRFGSGGGKKKFNRAYLRAPSLHNTRVKTAYGLNEPLLTGLLCGMIGFVGSVIEIGDLEQFPEFVSANDYLRVEASSDLNVGKTIANYLKIRRAEKQVRRKKYGSVNVN
jgi:hypothetical protein